MHNFQALGIGPELCAALKNQGITDPTPVQEKVIPLVLNRRDVIAQAQTGTGKTFAFILPILEMINPEKDHIQALIITPTRELALQITTEIKKIIKNIPGVNVLAVYGGQDVERQMQRLKGNRQIVVGTPGRLLDHLRRGTINLTKTTMLVLDEADQMLHMGFLAEVEDLIQNVPAKRQTMLFSATIPQQIVKLAANYMRKPEEVRIQGTQITLDEIKQIVVETTDRAKQATLFSLLDQHRPYLALIFCRTKRRASVLNAALQESGYDSDELHGDLSQAKREQVMKRFREAKIQFLVATDIAARGLDVEGVSHIYNYDIPHDAESYIHRIGRTGRAGGDGLAVTFVAQNDRKYLELIEKGIKASIKTGKNEASTSNKKTTGEKRPQKKVEDRKPRGKGKPKKEGWAEKSKTDKGRTGRGKPADKGKSDRGKPADKGRTERGYAAKGKPSSGRPGLKSSSKTRRSR